MTRTSLSATAILFLCLLAAGLFAQRVPQGQWVYCVAFSPDGKKILTGGATRKVQWWDASSGKELKSFDHPGWMQAVTVSPDGKKGLTGTRNRTARLWDLETGTMLREVTHGSWVDCVIFLPDGKSFLTLGGDDRDKGPAAIRMWDADSGREIPRFKVEADSGGKLGVNWGSLSADGKTLATGGKDTVIWNVETGEIVRKLPGHDPFTWEVALSPDGKTCVTGGADKLIRICDVESGRTLKTIRLQGEVRSLAISADSKLLAAGGMDRGIHFYRLPGGAAAGEIARAHDFIVESLAFSPDGRLVLSGGFDGAIKLWDAKSGKLVRSFTGK